jgi:sulfur-carrier protein
MPNVRFTQHLQRFFPDLEQGEVPGQTVAEIIAVLNRRYPGLADYLVDEHGTLRQHVNVFINKTLVRDRSGLQDRVVDDDEIHILQALSGGRS